MAGQLPPGSGSGDSAKKAGWRRPLSYLLLAVGAAGIIFNNQVSAATGLPVAVLQIVTFGLFILGAILFYSVRETADRVSSYREVFSSKAPEEAASTEPVIKPAKEAGSGEPDEK